MDPSDRELYGKWAREDRLQDISVESYEREQVLRKELEARGIQPGTVVCRFCHWWNPLNPAWSGQCRRRAPFTRGFPRTHEEDMCGDFTRYEGKQ